MICPCNPAFEHKDGNLFFYYLIHRVTVQVKVAHACLSETFGSDGSPLGDEAAVLTNIERISDLVIRKAFDGEESPIGVMAADF
ncbi:hypothetical protein AWB70_01022 [Caballeronia cordobensis]|uniref:Uncharacterized protein n=1 Tax=Caballeronia cordobensis TaxID=1353886 RepID=A0A158FM79_CABCO|nr:hypothetical protein AWB70_01022 [Caballeronia cordobensis]